MYDRGGGEFPIAVLALLLHRSIRNIAEKSSLVGPATLLPKESGNSGVHRGSIDRIDRARLKSIRCRSYARVDNEIKQANLISPRRRGRIAEPRAFSISQAALLLLQSALENRKQLKLGSLHGRKGANSSFFVFSSINVIRSLNISFLVSKSPLHA